MKGSEDREYDFAGMSKRVTSSSNADGGVSKTKEERDLEEDSNSVDGLSFTHFASSG